MDIKAGPVPLTDDQVRALACGEAAPPEIARLIEAHAVSRKTVDRRPPGSGYAEKQRPQAASADAAASLREAHRPAATKQARSGGRPDLKPPQ